MNKIETYKKFVRELYVDKDTGHDFSHIERIISRIDELSDGIDPSPKLHRLYFLACFHGLNEQLIGNKELKNKTINFLLPIGWSQKEIESIFLSLARHITEPCTVEEMIVYDANYYEVLGPFGIAKAFTVGGAKGQTYEQTTDIFSRNIEKVVFKTPAGKKMYEHRRQYATDFLNKLRHEL